MPLRDLYRTINILRDKLKLPPVSEERFLEEITLMELCGRVLIKNGNVRNK